MNSNFVLYFVKTLKLVIIFTLSIIIIRSFIIEPGRINNRSMEPAFYDEDIFLLNKFTLLLKEPQRGQLVQYYDENSKQLFIKRIIGLPGEKISIHQNKVFLINDKREEIELTEPYLADNIITNSKTGAAEIYETIPEHEYFVLGDNRSNSNDSRYFGPIHRSFITGTPIKIYSTSNEQ